MAKILLIAYYFPPLSGAGVGRALSIFKYLNEHDIECDVLTVKPVAYRYFEPELLDGLNQKRIYRSHSWDPQRLMRMLGLKTLKPKTIVTGRKLTSRNFPDSKSGWIKPAVNLGRVLAENKHYDAIISTSPPISTHMIGMKLSEEFNLPWIADFRDFWTSYKVEDWFEDDKMIKKGKELLDEIVLKATEVTTVNQKIADYLGRGRVIYNSYDRERAKLWQPAPESDEKIIGVLGTVDELTPIEPLFEFLAQIKINKPELFEKLSVVHVGSLNIENIDHLLGKYELSQKFISHGHQSREKTIQILNQTSIMFYSLDKRLSEGIIASRLFDLFASGRPIIASVPNNSETIELLKEINNTVIIDRSDYNSSIHFLSEKIKKQAEPVLDVNYSSDRMVIQFKEIINQIIK